MKHIKKALLLLLLLSALLLSACGKDGYRNITAENAEELMQEEHDAVVLDVRTPALFEKGHVPDAVNLPIDTIGEGDIAAIPQKDQPVFVYAETESDAVKAAKMIVSLGYTRVYAFGSFDAWQGLTVAEKDPEHIHVFSIKESTGRYFVKDATEKTPTVFRYSCACGEPSYYKTFTQGRTADERIPVGKNAKEALDGKKILFAGNAYNYYGKTVSFVDGGVTEQAARMNDTGYFYELCKKNGATVNVTNWSFGNHTLADLFDGSCSVDRECDAGHDHLADLTDRNYDYVSLMDMTQVSNVSEEEYIESLKSFMKVFTDVNPDCKFIFSIPSGAYWYNHRDSLGAYPYVSFAEKIAALDNVIVMDWGRLIYDLVKQDTSVPGSSLRCSESSLITPDGQNPNLLSGYIHTLMTYCAITGETAVGQPTALENGTETGNALRFQKTVYIEKIYKGKSTNFTAFMDSETEMKGIQQLIDRYLDMETYRFYK